MNATIQGYLKNLHLAEAQTHQQITVFPLQAARNGAPDYVALAEAMASKTITVTEVSEGGSVPQLLVLNDGTQPVLIIDGEELIGAKQNRILNTSILLKERSRTYVPVSCTEQGRWAYASAQFCMSDAVLERKIRSRKSRSVSQSLAESATPQSNQGEVWHGIHELQAKAKFASPTSAMNDVFKAQQERLSECLKAFPCQANQVGLLVVLNGRVAGLDLVSRPEVYALLHERLVSSYVLDALLETPPTSAPAVDLLALTRTFLASLEQSREEVFPSVGYGRDHRFHATGLTGSALVHDEHVIHAAFLTLEESVRTSDFGHLSSLRRRRHFRED